ncbi:carbohydrate ABC transporter permease [Metamycoplasma buccale]|uniref:carbohydrate ABC transporter permease n=1 Tax=Metamycoplasma buccale TaxID=55602 RepID=UPI00398F55AA
MSLIKLKIRQYSQKRYLKSKQEWMAKPIENSKPTSIILSWVFKFLVLAFFGALLIFPFYFMINQSLLDKDWQNDKSTILWYPKTFGSPKGKFDLTAHWENFKAALEAGYGKAILYTAATVAISVTARIFFSMTFGYAFSIRKWKGKSFLWVLFLSLLILPEVALMSGQYKIMVTLGWNIGHWRMISLIMPFAASVFSGFMYKNAFEAIPDSVKESAMIDGAGGFKFFTKVAMPMVKATTWTVAILTALASWNSYTWALLVMGKQIKGSWTVINVWLNDTGKDPSDPLQTVYISIRMAATVLAIIPMVIVYFLLRKRIMNAISRQGRATKG